MVCSFTGHREIPREHLSSLSDLLKRAVAYAYSEGCRTFCAGGALGFDTLAAREVILFRMTHPDVSLVLLLPCIDQDKSWGERQQSDYQFILKNADSVEYVSDEYTKGCMKERNMALAERCDIMIAYVGKPYSGAGQTVRFAERLNKRVYNLFPSVKASLG